MSRTVRSRVRAVAATGAAALMLAACTASPDGASSGSSDTGAIPPEYQRMVLVGASQGGALYNWVVGASQIFNDKLGMETSVQAGATQANALDLQSNVIKFGTTSPLDLVQVSGDPTAVESSNVRTLINAMSTPFHVVVAGDAGINSIRDLAGKGVATGVTGSIESEVATTMLECADAQGAAIQNIGKTEGAAAFNDGAIDVWTGLGSTPTAAFLEVFESKRGAKLLPLDGDTATCVTDKYPYLTAAVIPGGTYPGQTEDVVSLTQWFYAAVSQDMPAEVVETLFRALIDNHEQFVAALPTASESTAKSTAEFVGFPIHEGTQAVLDELGLEVPVR